MHKDIYLTFCKYVSQNSKKKNKKKTTKKRPVVLKNIACHHCSEKLWVKISSWDNVCDTCLKGWLLGIFLQVQWFPFPLPSLSPQTVKSPLSGSTFLPKQPTNQIRKNKWYHLT